MDQNNPRTARLIKIFDNIIKGATAISPSNGPLFLEAIYTQPSTVGCLERLSTSPFGISALRTAIRYDLSTKFLNTHASSLLQFLNDQDLRAINNGSFLNDILIKLVEPPIFWTDLRKAFLKGELDDKASHAFGWLLLQLCMLPASATDYQNDIEMPNILQRLDSSLHTRSMGKRIDTVLKTCMSGNKIDNSYSNKGAGGRHDNDHPDFRQISILPTSDEIECSAAPFLRPSSVLEDPATEPSRVALHLDNQFRLLREDMIYEMREELQVATGKKKGFHRGVKVERLELLELECGPEGKREKWGLVCVCEEFPQLGKIEGVAKRKAFLKEKPNFFKHQSLACLLAGKEIIGFPTIYRDRDEQRLIKSPPEIILQFEDAESTKNALLCFKLESEITLIQINTAVFAFEPILKGLQQAKTLPLSSELLLWKNGEILEEIPAENQPIEIVRALRTNPQANLKYILGTAKDIKLDSSQANSLISGLTQKISLIQGPPGTGKSFIGALIAKAIHDHTEQTILVVCYTNHALDDILTSLLDIGIPQTSMLRLGGKSTLRTEPLTISKQARGASRNRFEWSIIDELKVQLEDLYHTLDVAFRRYHSSQISLMNILGYLEFEEDDAYFKAFTLPSSEDGMEVVGRRNKAAEPDYLLDRWSKGQDAGPAFSNHVAALDDTRAIWDLPEAKRNILFTQWKDALLREAIVELCAITQEYNRCQRRLAQAFRSDTSNLLRSKRIVGCTTTAAAKYSEEIQTFNPNILLVEEAGEILESHVLISLGPETSQMILIGDHKQLRPKVNNYALTVEKGDGFDLNRSLFERLILKDYPHETLTEQHRMRPEISALIRQLTYPELKDAPTTQNRPNILGVRDNIVFINHDYPEDENKQLADRRDMASTSSKQNTYEVNMILKIVRYLGQQGYGTNELVILTPYLGQLQKLRESLKKDNDPILNDLDSFELIRAGLIDPAAAKIAKKPIRLATIDNYQGEESDIVVVSLTRSNPRCDIGFMFAPERLNVLLSRARNGLIMLGNAHTFKNARKGKELWQSLFEMLGHDSHIYQGLPVKCERHEVATQTLSQPQDFDNLCPDGGCLVPCGVLLSCGLHPCPSKCHQLQNHSKVKCEERMSSRCQDGHLQTWRCTQGPPQVCGKCERAKKLAKDQRERELAAEAKRDAEQKAHLEVMDTLNAQIEQERRLREDEQLQLQQAYAAAQRRQDLEDMKMASIGSFPPVPIPDSPETSTAQQTPIGSNRSFTAGPNPTDNSAQSSPTHVTQTSTKPSLLGKVWTAVSSLASSIPGDSPKTKANVASSKGKGKPFRKLPESPSKQEWQRQKSVYGAQNAAIDAIMDMTGLEEVKKQVMAVQAKIETSVRQNSSLKQERFNVVLLGNPGTGKTTIARLYAKFLASVKAIPGDAFEERTGARLAQDGPSAAEKLLEDVTKAGGGAIFIDEAYQLTSGNNYGGAAVLDYLLAEMENRVGTLVFILAGYNKDMEKFFEHNPGLKSRVPYQFQFADYQDEELMTMFQAMVVKQYAGGRQMKIEDGVDGLYGRIAIRRLGRRRGQPGFGNARDLQAVFSKIRERQAVRLNRERKEGRQPNDFLMIGQDLIGPDPSDVLHESDAWKELQEMIGLKAVKETITSLLSLIGENYQRELLEKEPIALSLNRVFLGSPGTGKTTVAKLYGQILADMGLLSNGEVIIKNPADFVGAVLGASETNTKAILANSIGKVLIIDEAYMLYGGGGNDQSGGQSNQYKTSVIDTIVAEVQSTPGEDRCVLLLGYTAQMIEMFQNVNPGLSRRFKIEDAFNFEDFTDAELLPILELKLKKQDLDATEPAKKIAIDLLARMRNRPNFGNAGEVENIIMQAKTRAMARRLKLHASERTPDIVFEPVDFDPDHNRAANASANLTKLFEDIVGHEDIIKRLANYQQISQICKNRDIDPRDQVPTNFVFTGPPGTGKTTVARKVGQVFYDMGLLSSAAVIECSASDLVGQFVGQTGPKTKKLFETALGKVLFIDEAYRLSEGHFAQEAIDELVGLLTHPTFKSKLIVILAGYERDMNNLMSVNTGLASRFPHQVVFPNMSAEHCLTVVKKELNKKQVEIDEWDQESSLFLVEMKELVRDLTELPDWGNARDMMTLSKEMISFALLKDDGSGSLLKLSSNDALDIIKKMVSERQRRSTIPKKHRAQTSLPEQNFTRQPAPPPTTSLGTAQASATPPTTPTPASPNRGRGGSALRNSTRGGRGGQGRDNETASQPHQAPAPVHHAPRSRAGRNNQGATQHAQTPNAVQASGPRGSRGGRGGGGRNNQTAATERAQNPTVVQRNGSARDPGVSDAVWQQLCTAKQTASQAENRCRNEIRVMQQKLATERKEEEERQRKLVELERALAEARDAAARAEIERQKEEARRIKEAARIARVRAEAALRAKQEAERRRKEEEERVQRKLREMGVCMAGFQWINMGSYYRCAGGSHTVTMSQLGM